MGLQEALQNIWSSDYVQKNPNKAYKTSYGSEYAAVAAYLNGGAEPNWSGFSKMGKGLCEVEKERRLAVPPVDPPPVDPPPVDPPPSGSAIPSNGVIAVGGTYTGAHGKDQHRCCGRDSELHHQEHKRGHLGFQPGDDRRLSLPRGCSGCDAGSLLHRGAGYLGVSACLRGPELEAGHHPQLHDHEHSRD